MHEVWLEEMMVNKAENRTNQIERTMNEPSNKNQTNNGMKLH